MRSRIKTVFIFLLLGIPAQLCMAQSDFYTHVPLGSNSVGYYDTLIYSSNTKYAQFDYRGNAPLFVQVWHPLKKTKAGNFLTYGDLRKRSVPKNLQNVYEELWSKTDTAFIDCNLAYALDADDPINYGSKTMAQVLQEIKSFKTKSVYAKQNGIDNFPVIVYHHGAQGLSDENYVMAEYFASRGYIFVSANFHLPYEDMDLGSEPFTLEQAHQNNVDATKQLIQFAKTLSNTGNTIFMGHSWGAQSGWCVLHEQGLVDAFVSFETTLEFKSDTNVIRKKWPFEYEAVTKHAHEFTMPVLLFAGTQTDAPFTFFKQGGSKLSVHASAKNTFDHNSYTAVFLMRYFLPQEFIKPDNVELKAQLELYAQHLAFAHYFLECVLQNKAVDKQKFEADFYIN